MPMAESPATTAPTSPEHPPADASAMLAIRDLHCTFGGVRAVDGVSFDVEAGSIVGLIGPNGAGKSTVLKAIGGEVRPAGGEILFRSQPITGQPSHRIARRGLIRTFQLGGEFGRLTVMENLLVAVPGLRGDSLWGALAGRRWWGEQQRREVEHARQVLAGLDLLDKQDAYANELSGGQRKLVEIGRALMTKPTLLLLDEPMAGVNRSLARRIEAVLERLRVEGMTMLLVEHELDLVGRLCDRVVVMANGRRVAEGDMHQLRSHREVLDAYLGS